MGSIGFSRSLAGRLALVVLPALLLGTAFNFVYPRRIPWVQDWSKYVETAARKKGISLADLEDAHRIVAEGSHLVLDARPEEDYHEGHLPGAYSVPYINVEEALLEVEMLLTAEQPILVYCSGVECDESLLLAGYLKDQSFTNVTLFAGGFAQWRSGESP